MKNRKFQLFHPGSLAPIVEVEPDSTSPLYRIVWSDGPSDRVNLSRAKDAALGWAEVRLFRTEHRKIGAGRALKSLDNFSWASSPMRLTTETRHLFQKVAQPPLRSLDMQIPIPMAAQP